MDTTTVVTTTVPPIQTSTGQKAAIAVIVIAALVSLVVNGLLFLGQIFSRKPKTGFDILVLNQLLVNIFLTLLIYPYDVVGYVVLDRQWPFSGAFCHISTFFTSFLPFIGCWCAAIMALHQLICMFGLVLELNCAAHGDVSKIILATLKKSAPTLALWIQGLAVHCPIAYSMWTVQQGPNLCSLDGENGLLHDSVWYFWIPFSVSCFTLTALFIVRLATFTPIPRDEPNPVNPIVRYSPGQTNRHYSQFSPTILHNEQEQLDARLVQVDREVEVQDQPAEIAAAETLEEPQELHANSLWITVLFTATLVVFVGPYCVFLTLFHFVEQINFEPHLIYWDIGFGLMCSKPVFEPFVLLFFTKYRRSLTFWKWRREFVVTVV